MDTGELAWAVTATALVLLMTPGLAFFYGGLVKAKSVVSMMMMSFGSMALVGVLWVLYGYNMSGVESTWAFAGNPFSDFGLFGIADSNEDLIGVAFGATFAIITTALISGAIADRAKFGAWMLFAGIWATVVYFPVAAWVWGDGWIMGLGDTMGLPEVIDYAGGTAVHINAGAAALALAIVLGRRVVFEKGAHKPHNVPLVMLGAALLWFGWFGFNGGSVLSADPGPLGLVFTTTALAAAAGAVVSMLVSVIVLKKPDLSMALNGVLAGLVSITAGADAVGPGAAIIMGAIGGVIVVFSILFLDKIKIDDPVGAISVHGTVGIWGTIAVAIFAPEDASLISQIIGVVLVYGFAFIFSFVVFYLIKLVMGVRVSAEEEAEGLDIGEHGQPAYHGEASA